MALARSTEQPETRGCRPTLLRIQATRRLLAHSPSLSPEAVIGQPPLVQQSASGAACHGGTVAVHKGAVIGPQRGRGERSASPPPPGVCGTTASAPGGTAGRLSARAAGATVCR